LAELRVCKKRSFDWWQFKHVCTEYGVELKGKTFKPKRFLKQFPVQPMKSDKNVTAKGY
jgi:hypothetical protein